MLKHNLHFVACGAPASRIRSVVIASLAICIACVFTCGAARAMAEKQARSAPGASKGAWSKIDEGRALQRSRKLDDAAKSFEAGRQVARDDGDAWAEAAAINCQGLLLADRKQYQQAAQLLGRLPLEESDPQAFVYRYNCARAWERSGDASKAQRAYRDSVARRPDFEDSTEAAYALAMQGDGDVSSAIQLGKLLLDKNQPMLVRTQVIRFLDALGSGGNGGGGAVALLDQLAQAYTGLRLSYKVFDAEDRPRLVEIAKKHEGVSRGVGELTAYFLAPAVETPPFQGYDPKPATEHDKVTSALLKTVADGYADDSKPEQAASRYLAAWRLDHQNSDAVIYYAALLRNSAQRIDPDGQRMQQLLDELIDEKGQSYRLPQKSRQDYLALVRLHSILGTLFEKSPPQYQRGRLYTPEYHWGQAVKLQDELKERVDPAFKPSPVPYLKLAAVQQKDPYQARDAWALYLAAADLFGADANKASATKAIESARGLMRNIQLNDADKKRFQDVTARVAGLPDASRGSKSPGASIAIPDSQWLPTEYRSVRDVTPDQARAIKDVNDRYESKMRAEPVKSAELEKKKREDLDKVLTESQVQQVQRTRAEAQQSAR